MTKVADYLKRKSHSLHNFCYEISKIKYPTKPDYSRLKSILISNAKYEMQKFFLEYIEDEEI